MLILKRIADKNLNLCVKPLLIFYELAIMLYVVFLALKMSRRKDIRKYYYDMEPVYQKILAEGGAGWPMESQQTFIFLLHWARTNEFRSGQNILEIGCGGGELAIELAKRNVTVEACDLSETAVKLCKTKSPPDNLNFFVGNAMTHRGFPNPPYDYIIANQLLQNIIGGDRVFLLKRLRENLAPDGIAVIATMLGIPEELVEDVNAKTRVNSENTKYFADLDMFAREITEAKFKPVRHVKINEYYRVFFLVKS